MDESEIMKKLEEKFVTKEDLNKIDQNAVESVVKIMDEPCSNENENCVVHKKLDEKQSEAFIKGVGLGRATKK